MALRALNCAPTDPFFASLVEYHRPLSDDVVDAPRGAPWHWLAAALLAHQGGTGSRLAFHHAQKHRLVAWQRGDGVYVGPRSRVPYRFERAADGPAVRTAIAAIVLLLPAGELELVGARADGPSRPRRDGGGAVLAEATAPADAPPDARTMKFGSLEEAREFLESMGIDPDTVRAGGGSDEADGPDEKDG